MSGAMKRVLLPTAAVIAALLVSAPAALAHDGGEGWYGVTTDKVTTNAGYILTDFSPFFKKPVSSTMSTPLFSSPRCSTT